ncbi:SDR family NAD(P)-dependent oxidoreductase [Micromonospora sediminicola]|uniref:SDR family NAD(P)-dependent oxidoreductase n=1 Tax=Micromonospora sediminicola TaxID=946078 RepID=UPI0033F15708
MTTTSPTTSRRPAHTRANRRCRRFLDLYGPAALITGASSGIGREIAIDLARRGFDLVLVARSEDDLLALADELVPRCGINVMVLPLDLSEPTSVHDLVAATAAIDLGLCVAAAGFGTSGPFLESSLPRELAMLEVNAAAVLRLVWEFGGRFAQRGRGGIVLMSSIVGLQGTPYAAHYAATKAYVQTLAEGVHAELGDRGVRVLAAAPGPVHSGFAASAGLRMWPAMSARRVARATLDALGRRPTSFPGMLSRVLHVGLAPLPRRARVRIMGLVMARMTAHRR